jgi:acetyl-CoA carboxylase biotin carboxyl carrier protein
LKPKIGMKRKNPSKSAAPKKASTPELEQIEQILRTMSEHNLEEFEYSRGDLRIRIKKPSGNVVYAAPPRLVAEPEIIVAGAAPASTPAAAPSAAEARPAEDLHLVKSPIVGTFYGSPSPGAEPFVKIGGHVDAGATLCIVEAMKLMNEIESDVSGEVLRVFVDNGQPVEYGQPLFGIRPSRKK